MKELIENMKFTKKSIIFVVLIVLSLMLTVYLKVGFSDKTHLIISIIALVFLFIIAVAYATYVLCLYYKLPKNKTQQIGVLFYVNTHNDSSNYKAITDKFCEYFKELACTIDDNKLVPIVLTEKQVSAIKNISDHDVMRKLLKKTKCCFGAFMKSTDLGEKSDEYELQMQGMITHRQFSDVAENIFSNNFNHVFRNLHVNTLSKKNDLKNLQNLSTQLFFVCQLIIGTALEYSGYCDKAIQIFKAIESKIKNDTSSFYKQMFMIINCEICSSVIFLTNQQYYNFVYNDEYDTDLVDKSLKIMSKSISIVKNDSYKISYHMTKAVYKLICGELIESKGEISFLNKEYSNIKPNRRLWAYSEAFLIAYENNPKKYKTINDRYKSLKNNRAQREPLLIYHFIDKYISLYPDNLGLKIALLLLVYYKQEDINSAILPDNLQQEVAGELSKLGQMSFAQFIGELEFK